MNEKMVLVTRKTQDELRQPCQGMERSKKLYHYPYFYVDSERSRGGGSLAPPLRDSSVSRYRLWVVLVFGRRGLRGVVSLLALPTLPTSALLVSPPSKN
jgi:hypothetical protein